MRPRRSLRSWPTRRCPTVFDSMAQGTTGADVEGYFMIADALATFVTSAQGKLSALAPCLGMATVASDCAKTFIEQFGKRLYRRPLAPDEVSYLMTVHTDGAAIGAADGVRFVLFAMLQSPHFLYRVETSGDAAAASPDTYPLQRVRASDAAVVPRVGNRAGRRARSIAQLRARSTPPTDSVARSIACFPTPRHAPSSGSSSASGSKPKTFPRSTRAPSFWRACRAWASRPRCRASFPKPRSLSRSTGKGRTRTF